MPRHPLSAEQVEQFRKELCELALERFAEDGYEAVSMRKLARDLGCSYTTPYRYFRDKAHIFAAVRALAFERFAAALEAGSAESSDPRDRIDRMARAYVGFALEQPRAYRMMFEYEQPVRDEHPEYWAKERDTWTVWEETIRGAVVAGVLVGDPTAIAHALWAGVHGAVSLHLSGQLILGQGIETLWTDVTAALVAAHQPPDQNTPRR